MGVMGVIKERRSVRAFKTDKVPDDILLELVEAGTWAPSASNIQAWYFIVVNDQHVLEQTAAFSPGLLGNPPALIVACSDKQLAFENGGEIGERELCLMDLCMASQNIMLLATEKGLGTCPIKSFNGPALSKILRLPDHISPELVISIGYPKNNPPTPLRKPVNKVSYFNKWGDGIEA
ncbi:MAG: nitroreductase family protein [Firmicutes bacterium]|jgi:nitroreductase|nr:nitroreductase family protein [Bacillota bacterium]